jgi:hypothetical protein
MGQERGQCNKERQEVQKKFIEHFMLSSYLYYPESHNFLYYTYPDCLGMEQ